MTAGSRHLLVRDERVGHARRPELVDGAPNASAWACASAFASSSRWWSPSGFERARESDEVHGTRPSLMQELVEAVLAVRPRLAPDDRRRVDGDGVAVERDVLAVRLHHELLEVRGEPRQVLLVREHGMGLGAEEVAVPDAQETHEAAAGWRRAAPRRSAGRPRGSRRACPRRHRARSRASSRARSRSPSSTGHRPSPRSRTRSPGRSRTPRPPRGWSTPRPRAARSRSRRRRGRRGAIVGRCAAFVIVSTVVKVFEETITSVSPGRGRGAPRRSCVASTLETNRNAVPRSL